MYKCSASTGRIGHSGHRMANVTIPQAKSGTGLADEGSDYDSILKTVVWPSLYWKDRTNSFYGGGWMRSDAYSGVNNEPTVNAAGDKWYTEENNLVLRISEDTIVEGKERFDPRLFAPRGSLYLGGEPIALGTALGRSKAQVSIIDNDFDYGILRLSSGEYRVDEHVRKALITVERVKGDVGEVSVDFEVVELSVVQMNELNLDGGSAAVSTGELTDFLSLIGTLTFAPGEMSKNIEVQIVDCLLYRYPSPRDRG